MSDPDQRHLLRSHVRKTLNAITDEVMETLVDKLVEIGCETLDDLKLVTASDLESVVKPIQARKLLLEWTQDSARKGK
jgi:hypothetical protein